MEINRLKGSKYASHFVGSEVYSEGHVYTVTKVDQLFLLLPILSTVATKLSPYEQIRSEVESKSPGLGSLCTASSLSLVCEVSDCMGDDMLLYKLSPPLVLSWLSRKHSRVRKVLEGRREMEDVRNRATDKMSFGEGFVQEGTGGDENQVGNGEGEGKEGGKMKSTEEEHAALAICEYLDGEWGGKFLDFVGVSRTVLEEKKSNTKRKNAWDKGRDVEADKIMKYTMGEFDGKAKEEGKKKVMESKVQKDLKKASRGMKSLSSFFGKK